MGNQWFIFLVVSLLAFGGLVHGSHIALLHFVESAVEKGAVCLDGSPPAYYFQPGTGCGASNWLVFLEGGGWCPTSEECLGRSRMLIGGTRQRDTENNFKVMFDDDPAKNPNFHDWNIAYVTYCDGSSFTGDVEEPDPVTNVTYRGSRLFDAVIDDLLARGMNNASSALLAGVSAGGLATMFNCDHFRDRLPNANRVKCISDAGFFRYGEHLTGTERRKLYFGNVMKLHGMEKFLSKKCTSSMEPSLCMFPENFVNYIETPLLILESTFDAWQFEHRYLPYIWNGNMSDWDHCTTNVSDCTCNELQRLQEFQRASFESLRKVEYSPSRGIFVHSCYIHGALYFAPMWNCPISGGNTSVSSAVGDWYFDRRPINIIEQDIIPRNCTKLNYTEVQQQCVKHAML